MKWFMKVPKWGWAAIIIAAFAVISLGIYAAIIPNRSASTTVKFEFTAQDTGTGINGSALIYGSDITGLTIDEIGALHGTDFTYLGTNLTGEGFTPDFTTYRYVAVVTYAGYCDEEFTISTTGTYAVVMLPSATNTTAIAFSATLQTDLTSTTETNWTFAVQCVNSTGGANASLGFRPFYNFIGNGSINFAEFGTYTNQFLVELQLNAVADADYITSVNGISADVEAIGNSLFIKVKQDVVGRRLVDVNFATGIGTTFNVTAAYTGFGAPWAYTLLGTMA